ncbi:XRE family transcriptional regulator [beta proteobacterium AAP121]|nr:XRE family transcriptional regulator [beta proteobacterium AAP65]KPF96527.1 XRE family transcriptional regulator [beta proteobacterium AAP121]
MSEYPLRTAEQLSVLLQAFRKESGLTQSEVALRLGVTQQTYSTLERNAETVGVGRLLKLLGILGVELVLSKPASITDTPTGQTQPEAGDKPAW